MATLNVDSIKVNGNTISSTDTDGDINLTPNGTGSVVVNGATIDGYATTSEVQGTHTTGTITSGTTALTVASGTGISTGDYVVGEGITPGTTVSAISGTSVTLSANANATLSGDPVSFYKSTKLLSPGLVAGQLCRAWVNFDGTSGSGTGYSDITIRASYNVSSITDNGTGDYTITFTNAMPDINYTIINNSGGTNASSGTSSFGTVLQINAQQSTPFFRLPTTTSFRILSIKLGLGSYVNDRIDCGFANIAIFR